VLLAACSGFPKIHRVWDYVLGVIFTLDEENLLPKQRLANIFTVHNLQNSFSVLPLRIYLAVMMKSYVKMKV